MPARSYLFLVFVPRGRGLEFLFDSIESLYTEYSTFGVIKWARAGKYQDELCGRVILVCSKA